MKDHVINFLIYQTKNIFILYNPEWVYLFILKSVNRIESQFGAGFHSTSLYLYDITLNPRPVKEYSITSVIKSVAFSTLYILDNGKYIHRIHICIKCLHVTESNNFCTYF